MIFLLSPYLSRSLSLISVRNVNYLALAHISRSCPELRALAVQNCDLGDFLATGQPNSDAEYNRWQEYLEMTRQEEGSMF